jgi:hypothetical protein
MLQWRRGCCCWSDLFVANGIRELISRRRRAKARRRHFERLAEEATRTSRKLIAARPEARLAIGFQSGEDPHAPPEGEAS